MGKMALVRDDVARFLDMLAKVGGPPLQQLDPAAARLSYRQTVAVAGLPAPDSVDIGDFTIPGPAGAIPARSYYPAGAIADGTVILFFHGGGFVLGDLDSHNSLAAEMARLTGYPLVAAGYRLAPEHPFPAAIEDGAAAARFLPRSGEAAGFPVSRLILAGDSAGGTVAAVLARLLRREVAIAAQWLLYPATDLQAAGGSLDEFAEGYMLTGAMLDWFGRHHAADPASELASPLRSDDWEGLPPALVFTCGLDPLRDQGRAYAGCLAAAGNRLVFREAAGQIHGAMQLRRAIPSAVCDLEQQAADLRALLL